MEPGPILDVGGGPGVHAAWLAADGHDVHLVDPVQRHVDQARDRGLSAAVGDARRLARQRVVWAAEVVEAEPSLRGLSPHLLAVSEVH